MASKAIQRTLLIVILIVTAHALKPFSVRSLTRHLLRSANSFSFMLPSSALCSLERADYLARVLDGTLHQNDVRPETVWHSALAETSPPAPERQCATKVGQPVPLQVATRRGSPAQGTSPRAKRLEVACQLKRSPRTTALELPVTKVSEQAVALRLPLSDVMWVESRGEELRRLTEGLSQQAATLSLTSLQCPRCEGSERLKVKLEVCRDDAQQRLMLSLQRLLASARPARTVYLKTARRPRANPQPALACS